jgi:hypothetical protein
VTLTSAIGNVQALDLNIPSRGQLEQIGGIKGERSERLIESRPFHSWGDVEKVPGFNPKLVEDLKNAGATLGGDGEGGRSSGSHRGGSHGHEAHGSSGGGESEKESLAFREYTDAQGNVHHHTRTYEEQHGSKK